MPKYDSAIAKKVLKEISAFKKFKNEIYYGDTSYSHDFWEYAKEHRLDDDFIEDAFDWESSKEGYDFWNEVDEYWRDNWLDRLHEIT